MQQKLLSRISVAVSDGLSGRLKPDVLEKQEKPKQTAKVTKLLHAALIFQHMWLEHNLIPAV
jgi:hypothetical protein